MAPVRTAASAFRLKYFGGPVMQAGTRTVPIFWEPPTLQDGVTSAAVDPDYNSLTQRFLQEIGGHGLYNNLTQYYQLSMLAQRQYIVNSSGMLLAIVDPTPYPAAAGACLADARTNCITDDQLQAEIASVIGANSLPTEMSTFYAVLTAPGEESCIDSITCFEPNPADPNWVYCAYHGMFSIAGKPVIYANMPYLHTNYASILGCGGGTADPNLDPAFDDETSALSHEFSESITDPDPVNGAWFDNNTGYEIGDICNAQVVTVTWGIHRYAVQREWSNATGSCVRSGNDEVSLSPAIGPAGSSTRVFGVRFQKNEQVRFSMTDASGAVTNLGTAMTDGSGAFHAAVSIRGGAPGGVATIDATGAKPSDGASAGFTVSGASKFRPDLMVSASKSGPWSGNNVYNITGAGQVIARAMVRGHATSVWLVVQNDGDTPDTYTLKGPRFPAGFSLVYRVGGANVTGQFMSGGYRHAIGPGETFLVRIAVRVLLSARIGSRFPARILVTSRGNVTHRDAVLLSVTAR